MTHEQRDSWERPGGTPFQFVNDGIAPALDQACAAAGEWPTWNYGNAKLSVTN